MFEEVRVAEALGNFAVNALDLLPFPMREAFFQRLEGGNERFGFPGIGQSSR